MTHFEFSAWTSARNMKAPFFMVVALAIALGGCASGTTTVMQPYRKDTARTFATVTVEQDENTVEVPDEIQNHFGMRLKQYLAEGGRYGNGDDLRVVYRFIQMDEGSRAARYFIGFGAGKGEMTVEVTYLDNAGTELARIQVGGEISGGFFGGDFDEAVSRAAREAAEYTFANF